MDGEPSITASRCSSRGSSRVGWGLEKKFAVLDSGSDRGAPERPFEVAWLPRRRRRHSHPFSPRAAEPIPDGDQSRYGYPVTLQVGLAEAAQPPVETLLRLHQGNEKGPEVECWFSSPQQPTIPTAPPSRAFCLIPKNPLAPKTRYTVVATWAAGGKPLQWSFTTR